MGIFSGLEKFGLKSAESMQLFEDEQKESEKKEDEKLEEQKIPPEEEFLLAKTVRCKVCDQVFKTNLDSEAFGARSGFAAQIPIY